MRHAKRSTTRANIEKTKEEIAAVDAESQKMTAAIDVSPCPRFLFAAQYLPVPDYNVLRSCTLSQCMLNPLVCSLHGCQRLCVTCRGEDSTLRRCCST